MIPAHVTTACARIAADTLGVVVQNGKAFAPDEFAAVAWSELREIAAAADREAEREEWAKALAGQTEREGW